MVVQYYCSRPLTNSANREYITVRSPTALRIREQARPELHLPYNTACTRMALAVRELADAVCEWAEALSQIGTTLRLLRQ